MGVKPGDTYLRLLRDRQRRSELSDVELDNMSNGQDGRSLFVPTAPRGLPSALAKARRMKERAREMLLKRKAEIVRQARRGSPSTDSPGTSQKRLRPDMAFKALSPGRGFDFAAAITSSRTQESGATPAFSPEISLDEILKDIAETADRYKKMVNEGGWVGSFSPSLRRTVRAENVVEFHIQKPICVIVFDNDEDMEDVIVEEPPCVDGNEVVTPKKDGEPVRARAPTPEKMEPSPVVEQVDEEYTWYSSESWFAPPIAVHSLLSESDWSDEVVEAWVEVPVQINQRSPEIVEEDRMEEPFVAEEAVEDVPVIDIDEDSDRECETSEGEEPLYETVVEDEDQSVEPEVVSLNGEAEAVVDCISDEFFTFLSPISIDALL